ncbi:MAG: GNAT family N-acetyltransferase [Candidatus Thorarchaeota archaeon]
MNITVRNGTQIRIAPYRPEHAASIANNLFDNVPVDVVRQQREELLAAGEEEVISITALDGERAIGICIGIRGRWYGERHRVDLLQIVVHEDYREQGVAKAMIKEVARHFAQRGAELLTVNVEDENSVARTAYKRIGFVEYGELPRGLKFNKRYSTQILMMLPIKDILHLQ